MISPVILVQGLDVAIFQKSLDPLNGKSTKVWPSGISILREKVSPPKAL